MYQVAIEQWWKALSTGSVHRLEFDGGYLIEWVTEQECAWQVGGFGTRRVLRRVVPS